MIVGFVAGMLVGVAFAAVSYRLGWYEGRCMLLDQLYMVAKIQNMESEEDDE